jgi:oligoendopeptidase F
MIAAGAIIIRMSNKGKEQSPLVRSVLALDQHLAELHRVGTKITSTDMTDNFDVEFIEKLMARFAECGQAISEEVVNLSARLHEAQSGAQAVAQAVSGQAELLNKRRTEQNAKLEEFRVLGDKVRVLNASISPFRRQQGEALTAEDREKLVSQIPAVQSQLSVLIEELQTFRKSVRDLRMRALEKNAESLAQTLEAARKKLGGLVR